ncbi:MAG: Nif3-like dinuclear metal center hexameric protein [Oscillospiraceae bacterium]|nr:Nif3-like dinuclear metal center hexameric protein [Oscillospiraceae bacterium]
MKVGAIVDEIEKMYHPYLAEKWDNVGLLCGNRSSDIKKIMVALDASIDVIGEAVLSGVNMIITHHPILFSGTKSVTMDTADGKIIYSLIKNNISLYAVHTNLDNSENGINRYVAQMLGLMNITALVPHESVIGAGTGVIGNLSPKTDMNVFDTAKLTKEVLKTKCVRYTGSPSKKVRKVAVVTGSGSDFIPDAIKAGADVLITGDVKYHNALDADFLGLSIIDAGHFATENPVTEIFSDMIKKIAPEIEVIKSSQKDVFSFI